MEACRAQADSEGAGIEGQLVPTLTVVAGPNGSGKSTLTRLGRETFQAGGPADG